MHPIFGSSRGFSIIMALGATGVLMVMVVSLASIFITEMRLSRLQYDSILSSTQAEGAFEYAMLKIANHQDGFADTMTSDSPDAKIFEGSSARTKNVKISYRINSQSKDYVFTPRANGKDRYMVIPLFTGICQGYLGGTSSCDPRTYEGIQPVRKISLLSHDGDRNKLSWSIIAQSGSENISINGVGTIDGLSERGVMRLQAEKCLGSNGDEVPCMLAPQVANPAVAESLSYLYDIEGTTSDFLNSSGNFSKTPIRNPYLLIYTFGDDTTIELKTDVPFTLPEISVIAEARKNDSLQAIGFLEDKSKYYDAIKYSIYNTNPD